MIHVEKSDMVVGTIGNTKTRELRRLIRVESVDHHMLRGVWLDEITLIPIEIPRSAVLANLGPKPPAGWVYGLSVSALLAVNSCGGKTVISRTDVPSGMEKAIQNTLSTWSHIFALLDFSIEIHPPYGKRMGSYQTKKRSGSDIMRIHPLAHELGEVAETMIHEAGHGVWNRLISPRLRALFIKHYTESVKITPTELKDIQVAAEDFDAHQGTISSYTKRLKPREKIVFKRMLKWIKEVHKIGNDDLEKLRFGGLKVSGYFPSHKIVMSAIEPVITQYGTKNAVEFFCEAFAYYNTKKPNIPKSVRVTMKELDTELYKIRKEKV